MRVGRHAIPVDGFCAQTNTIYQFHGCFWHGHPCEKTKNNTNHVRGISPKQEKCRPSCVVFVVAACKQGKLVINVVQIRNSFDIGYELQRKH